MLRIVCDAGIVACDDAVKRVHLGPTWVCNSDLQTTMAIYATHGGVVIGTILLRDGAWWLVDVRPGASVIISKHRTGDTQDLKSK